MDKNGDGLVTKQVGSRIKHIFFSPQNSIMMNCHENCFAGIYDNLQKPHR